MNPLTQIYDAVVAQFAGFSEIIASKVRVLSFRKPIDIETWLKLSATVATIWIAPGVQAESPFADAQHDDSALTFEIWITSPDSDIETLHDLEWLCKKAVSWFSEHMTTAGVALINPAPLEYQTATLSEFRNQVDPGTRSLKAVALLRVPVGGEADSIRGGPSASPPVIKEIIVIKNDSFSLYRGIVFFDQRIETMPDGGGQLIIRDGLGNSYQALGLFFSPGSNVGLVDLNTPGADAGPSQVTYAKPGSGTARFTGENGLEVDEVVDYSVPVTVVDD